MDTVASLLWLDVPILNPSSALVLIRALFLFFFFPRKPCYCTIFLLKIQNPLIVPSFSRGFRPACRHIKINYQQQF